MNKFSPDTVLVTGGAGFIGSNLVRWLDGEQHVKVINVDKLTYAGNLESTSDLEDHESYTFVKADVCDRPALRRLLKQYRPQAVMHLAAESHVDRSIDSPAEFITTNVLGTFSLLEECRLYFDSLSAEEQANFRVLGVSTDEVYGSLSNTGLFTESTPYDPSSPYSASKASADHLFRAYHRTYGLPVLVTNCSNNYGPYQFPEKLIPLIIHNAVQGKPLPVYGKGDNIRDWLYVEDHAKALWTVLTEGALGDTYNIGGSQEMTNLEVVHTICDILDRLAPPAGNDLVDRTSYRELITFVTDRPGHDFRYAIDTTKIVSSLGWRPEESFETGLEKTIRWYLNNQTWSDHVTSGEYRQWVAKHYDKKNV